jgi:hypothetical protein
MWFALTALLGRPTRMKRICICFLHLVAIQSLCLADVTKLPDEHRKVLEDSSRFHEVRATTNLPPAIVALCVDDAGRLAEPGRKWEATDDIRNPSLPRKRLIWGAVASEYYVVHYEWGGRGHSFHVLVATLAKGEQKPKVIWHGVGGRLKDYATFLAALRSGKLDDKVDYPH